MNSNFNLTKRHVGLFSVFTGFAVLIGTASYGSSGFGPAQKMATIAAICLIGIGITLLPLGDQPA